MIDTVVNLFFKCKWKKWFPLEDSIMVFCVFFLQETCFPKKFVAAYTLLSLKFDFFSLKFDFSRF